MQFDLREFSYWLFGIASLTGAVLSYFAFRSATRASRAAAAARDTVQGLGVVSDFERIHAKAEELLEYVVARNRGVVSARGRSLVSLLTQTKERWRWRMKKEHLERIDLARERFRYVSRTTAPADAIIADETWAAMEETAAAGLDSIAELLGALKALLHTEIT